jgi:hypothetical protein
MRAAAASLVIGVSAALLLAAGGAASTRQPPRARIPSTARVVTVTVEMGNRPSGAPVTITDPARVAELVRLINTMPILRPTHPPRFRSCFFGEGVDLRLAFADAPGAPVLGRAFASGDGCFDVMVSLPGQTGPLMVGDLFTPVINMGGIAYCRGAQLRSSYSRPKAFYPNGDGPYDAGFDFRNASRTTCVMGGYPRLAMLAANGRRLRSIVTRGKPAGGLTIVAPTESVGFGVSWSYGCPRALAATIEITLPGISRPFAIDVRSRRHPFGPCGGALTVSSL